MEEVNDEPVAVKAALAAVTNSGLGII